MTLAASPSTPPLLGPIRRHPHKTPLIRLVHLGHLDPVLVQLRHQLRRVEHTVAPPRLDDLALLLEREVGPRERRPHEPLEQAQDLVVADRARVGEVVDARLAVAGEEERGGQEVVEERGGVGHVDDACVGRDFGHERARVQVVRDGHAEAQDEGVGVGGQQCFGRGFRGGVE